MQKCISMQQDLDMSFNSMLTVLSNFLSAASLEGCLNFSNSSHFSFTTPSTLRSSPVTFKNNSIIVLHTGISFRNFFYHTILEGVHCPVKGTSSRTYNLFVLTAVFQPKWNDIKEPIKFFKSSKKLHHPASFETQAIPRGGDIMVFKFLFEVSELWRHQVIFSLLPK